FEHPVFQTSTTEQHVLLPLVKHEPYFVQIQALRMRRRRPPVRVFSPILPTALESPFLQLDPPKGAVFTKRPTTNVTIDCELSRKTRLTAEIETNGVTRATPLVCPLRINGLKVGDHTLSFRGYKKSFPYRIP